MENATDRETLALENCAREPIHRPGNVQPFGVLVAGPVDLSRIEYCSENAAEILGMSPTELLGQPTADVISAQAAHDIRNVLSMGTAAAQRERAGRYTVNGREVEAFAHVNPQGHAVVELEPLDDTVPALVENPIDHVRMVLGEASRQSDIDRFLKICVVGLRQLIGYDRVMAYRYAPNGDGEVIAEDCAPHADSFLGLRYPASDVPAQSRALQVKNPLRMLVDVNRAPISLVGLNDDADYFDMSLAHLRGVSPIHVEYLQNMGVQSTLTIGLVVDGVLWGMFACHHGEPRVVRSDLRITAELFGQMVSLLIQQKLEIEAAAARGKAEKARRQMLADTDMARDLAQAFPELGPVLSSVIDSDGVAVIRDGAVQTLGSVPPIEVVAEISRRHPNDDHLIDSTDTLFGDGWTNAADIGASAGCLVIRCAAAAPLQMLFFRDEKVRNLRWAGGPHKVIEDTQFGPRLHPRASFEAYVAEQRGHAPIWGPEDLEAARELQRLLTQITAKGERAQMARHKDLVNYQRQQELMIAELNHRVKNILALIRSLSRRAKASSASLESYAQALEQRISALAAAHDLAVSNTMQGVSLRGILETELQPYLATGSGQALLAGPVLGLRADVAPMIALVFHEIVSNAAKYGALSTTDGVVRASWLVDENGLSFHWRELGGPDVVPPTRHGFGRSLIEKAIPYEFDGDAALEYLPTGVSFTFRLPSENLVDLDTDNPRELVGEIAKIEKVASGTVALMVEDNLVLAMDMVDSLTRLGADTVETAGSVDEALRWVGKKQFDFAVLDMNLRGTVSFDVAERLREANTPFVFVSGYGASFDMPATLQDVPILTKPIDESTLALSLGNILKPL